MTAVRTATAAGLTATFGLAAACWVASVWQMTGMDMGVATRLGSFASFAAVWLAMMAAMMLPGAAPAVARAARVGGMRAAPLFAGSYLAVWALAGAVVFVAYRPHGTAVAGAVTIAAGAYELTPVKRHFRRRCQEVAGSGLGFGLCCLGSSAGLMAMLVVLDVMSVTWMAVIAVLVTAQKLLPPRAALDVPLALGIVALGVLLEREKQLTRMGDELARQRRELPWVPVEKDYTLQTEEAPGRPRRQPHQPASNHERKEP